MKQKIVGTYLIGSEQCQLVLREGDGGEFYNTPEIGHIPRIKIGADYRNWRDVITVLIHETFEFCMNRIKSRYECTEDFGRSQGGYMFMFDHNQFCDIAARSSEFITAALPELAKSWRQWKKESNK
jgi:hypothetical protein